MQDTIFPHASYDGIDVQRPYARMETTAVGDV